MYIKEWTCFEDRRHSEFFKTCSVKPNFKYLFCASVTRQAVTWKQSNHLCSDSDVVPFLHFISWPLFSQNPGIHFVKETWSRAFWHLLLESSRKTSLQKSRKLFPDVSVFFLRLNITTAKKKILHACFSTCFQLLQSLAPCSNWLWDNIFVCRCHHGLILCSWPWVLMAVSSFCQCFTGAVNNSKNWDQVE